MKKFLLTLLASLALSGINLMAADVPQPQESWYDWSKQKVQSAGQTVGHYMPSWHYWPAVAAGLVASGIGSPIIARKLFKRPELGLISGYEQVHMMAAQLIPYLMALGWGAKQIEHFIRGIQPQKPIIAYMVQG